MAARWCLPILAAMTNQQGRRGVAAWLLLLYAGIFGMVLLGGATRLTGSGLSMVDWRPLAGVLPPVGDAAWSRVLESYLASPQGQLVHPDMTLPEFREIFLWEYAHRVAGRLLGLLFVGPWLVLVSWGQLRGAAARRTLGIGLGIGAQGLLGWYMVRSGLVDVPAVSPFRLAAHLLLAFAVAQWTLWQALDLLVDDSPRASSAGLPRWATLAPAALCAIALVQIALGALVAGTHAGLTPARLALPPADLISDPTALHGCHQLLGLIVVLGAVTLCGSVLRLGRPALRRPAGLLAAAALLQLGLGVGAVVLYVPRGLALAHQAGAFLLLSAIVALWHQAQLHPLRGSSDLHHD
jgi:heme a synthase